MALAVRTPNNAMAEVAMSKTKGLWPARGTPTASGFVPNKALAPAAGATNSGEFASARQTTPFFAARSA